jgi:hypothetical protein
MMFEPPGLLIRLPNNEGFKTLSVRNLKKSGGCAIPSSGKEGGRGLISYSLLHFLSLLETPPCICTRSQPHPSRLGGNKKSFEHLRF